MSTPKTPTVEELITQIGEEHRSLGTTVKQNGADLAAARKSIETLENGFKDNAKAVEDIRRAGLQSRSLTVRPRGRISDVAARSLASHVILMAAAQGALNFRSATDQDRALGMCRDFLGINAKTTLSSSDIPQLTEYGREVVDLVGDYGLARKVGTVYPMGADSVMLPTLTADPVFVAIAAAGSVTEKSPALTNVELVAKKWGGIVRFPREIDMASIVNLGQFLARYGARNFARIEDDCFFSGDGTSTYHSLNGLRKVVDASGTRVVLASTKTANTDSTLANFRSVRGLVSAHALRNAAYYVHPTFESQLAGFNTSTLQPYRTDGARNADIGTGPTGALASATLDGFPIIWSDSMPALSTGAAASQVFAVFGDASYQYIGDRMSPEIVLSEQAYWTTDEIGIRFLERFTVNMLCAQTGSAIALAGIKTAAS